ncbi:C45 family autoproteolytic acyltransferase/hydolase [Nannocystis pusilla]|uniref:C45 family autoproteolytic acyltransferase/hydolase n=1 Tax=Nannocystis pusilla TaxID=889268 RepID=UPI003B7F0AE3
MFAAAARPKGGGERGNLVIGRSFFADLGLDVEPDRLVTIVHPDGKYPFASVGWAGLMGVVTGINARGIFVALDPTRTDDALEEGVPLPLILRQILEDADTLEQALEILQAAPARTSGAVLVGDGRQRRAAVVELARDRDDRKPRGDDQALVWATNHMLRESFERDAQNDRIRRFTSSGYRYDRLGELLAEAPVDPARAVAILRDRKGLGGSELGLGNRNAVDNLHLTHAVVVDATAMVMWVGEVPPRSAASARSTCATLSAAARSARPARRLPRRPPAAQRGVQRLQGGPRGPRPRPRPARPRPPRAGPGLRQRRPGPRPGRRRAAPPARRHRARARRPPRRPPPLRALPRAGPRPPARPGARPRPARGAARVGPRGHVRRGMSEYSCPRGMSSRQCPRGHVRQDT